MVVVKVWFNLVDCACHTLLGLDFVVPPRSVTIRNQLAVLTTDLRECFCFVMRCFCLSFYVSHCGCVVATLCADFATFFVVVCKLHCCLGFEVLVVTESEIAMLAHKTGNMMWTMPVPGAFCLWHSGSGKVRHAMHRLPLFCFVCFVLSYSLVFVFVMPLCMHVCWFCFGSCIRTRLLFALQRHFCL